MRRPVPRAVPALAIAAAAALGCQDYRFNPVGHCLIQPGAERVTLSTVSSADVLFVVDDSGSMGGEQAKLAAAFDAFIGSLNAYNDQRASIHLEPFDFHIGITTTSVFYNPPASAACQTTCGLASNVCCVSSTGQPLLAPKACPLGNECGNGFQCKTSCLGHDGEAMCCDSTGGTLESTNVACSAEAAVAKLPCGNLQEHYVFPRQAVPCAGPADCTNGFTCVSGCGKLNGSFCCSSTGAPELKVLCSPGNATEGSLYPHGRFVGLGTNPRVLHFDKQLYAQQQPDGSWNPVADPGTATSRQGFTRQQLVDFFKSNVNVGTCGSAEEQGLQAGRLAVSRALAGAQVDTRDATGAMVPAVADWPHEHAKLIVVYVGDEDDCSSPDDPVRGVVLTGQTGDDACVYDSTHFALPSPGCSPGVDCQKEFLVTDMAGALQALNRPLGAAFVVSTAQTSCVDDACTPGLCCDSQCTGSTATCRSDVCGGQGAGSRFLQAAGALRGGGADVIEASICDPGAKACSGDADCASLPGSACVAGCGGESGSYCCITSGALAGSLAGNTGFAAILGRVAEIVKPPSALLLPTQPASGAVTLLRIARADGTTRKTCKGPALPPLTLDEARAQAFDWWFTATRDQVTEAQKQPSAPTRFVYINHATGNCEANPGETYSADYLGQVPAGGCTSDADCTRILGGAATNWTCFAGVGSDEKCLAPSPTAVGTCLCGSFQDICPKG
jgi:hypothetical protein